MTVNQNLKVTRFYAYAAATRVLLISSLKKKINKSKKLSKYKYRLFNNKSLLLVINSCTVIFGLFFSVSMVSLFWISFYALY